jgi:predicted class III extradiol MEMO1 family dioxygenase
MPQMLAHCPAKFDISFTCYDQSSKATIASDSSVSYASAVVVAASDS